MPSKNTTTVQVLHEVWKHVDCEEKLCYQSCIYHFPDGTNAKRYRFMRRDKKGNLKAHRGQAGASHSDFAALLVAMDKRMKLTIDEFLANPSFEVK